MSKAQGLTVKKMKSEIQRMVKDLGIPPIKFNAAADLKNYRRGLPLTVGELRALPKDAVVWVYYKEHGERGPRINHPMRAVKHEDDDRWGLEDGSSFAAEFFPTGEYDSENGGFKVAPDSSECFDEGGGEGEMRLYHAKLISRPTAPSTSKKAPRKR